MATPLLPQLGRQSQETTNWKQCILCQKDAGQLVMHPRLDSYHTLSSVIQERALLNDGEFVQIHKRLEDCTSVTLQKKTALWHRTCYSNATNEVQMQRARDRHQRSLSTGSHIPRQPGRPSRSVNKGEPSTTAIGAPFTRSATHPLSRDQCFFCQDVGDQPLFSVRTGNSGQALKDAVLISSNHELKTRLATCISEGDAHAIDVQYHKGCWTKNVFHVLRDDANKRKANKQNDYPHQTASFIELVNIVDVQTKSGAYLSMEDIENTYVNMLGGAEILGSHRPAYSRQWLKDKLLSELPGVRSVMQSNRRKPGVLYCPEACEAEMVHLAITQNDTHDMKTIYKSAQLVRQSIEQFAGTQSQDSTIRVTSTVKDVPIELYTLIRWIMTGAADKLETEVRTQAVDRAALTISQNLMFGFKSKRQVTYKPRTQDAGFRSQEARQNPQALGLGLTIHHDTRNKKLLNLLNSHDYCVSYNQILMMETSLANAVVENTKQFQGMYVPPFLKKGSFVFFAADNADFAEDTPDGKGTTHGTITAVYQKADASGERIAPPLRVCIAQNLTVTPHHTVIMPCVKPKQLIPDNERQRPFNINKEGTHGAYQLTHLGWLIATIISRMTHGDESQIPGWAGYHSLLSRSKRLTEVGALPLLPEVAHEWPTMLTVLMQARKLKELVVGDEYLTVITFDMALYEKAIQLVDSRPELRGKVLPRLGELHVVMAALRALGSSIENSGIDDAWMEADLYGSATTRQILKCTHYKRSLRAHIYSYTALYELALEQFLEDNHDLKDVYLESTTEIENAVQNRRVKAESVRYTNAHLLERLTTDDMIKKLHEWQALKSRNPMFRSMMNYLHRVESILHFVAASRNADLSLHLEAGEALCKLFFAMDRIKYKRLWPRYLADMHALKIDYPDTWRELEEGNISVTKNTIPFVSIGADHACEHLNKLMKVHAGLVGISNNPNARQRFFLTAPELSCLAKEFKGQFLVDKSTAVEHHDLSPSAVKREHVAVSKIKSAILSHGNPFSGADDSLYNLITHAYIPDEFVPQILNIDDTGQKLYEDYVAERINGNISIWSPVQKQNNKMYTSGNKRQTVKIRDKTIDMKETKDLYGRLMVLARSNRDVDQKEAIGNYEFTLTPRALFAPSGSVLPCSDKSKLIHVLEKLASEGSAQGNSVQIERVLEVENVIPGKKIAVVDGMVLVQKLSKKPPTMVTVRDLSKSFHERLMNLTHNYDEVILVFDTYRPDSLKSATRQQRRQGKDPIQYQIKDDTNISHITMSRFLSHEKTKAALTEYLAEKIVDYSRNSSKLVITSASGRTRSNNDKFHFDDNNHEEADTLMICLAITSARRNPSNAQLTFFSPDTDVLVLVVANYDLLPKKTSICMTSSDIHIKPLWDVLGPEKARALPAFHAFSGADNTGRFARLGKATWFKLFIGADDTIIDAIRSLSDGTEVTEEVQTRLAIFVCAAYCPKGIHIQTIPELRWHLFCKYMAESDKLPPTLGALKQHVLRVHLLARVWGQSSTAQQVPLDPLQNGYYKDKDDQLMPTTTDVPPAPKAIIEMVRCQCRGDCASQRCSCRANNLPCTDLCMCTSQCENEEDLYDNQDSEDDDD